jgi:hypothetical protein
MHVALQPALLVAQRSNRNVDGIIPSISTGKMPLIHLYKIKPCMAHVTGSRLSVSTCPLAYLVTIDRRAADKSSAVVISLAKELPIKLQFLMTKLELPLFK